MEDKALSASMPCQFRDGLVRDEFHLTSTKRREIVVQEKGFTSFEIQVVDTLLIRSCSESCGYESLGFTACKDCRTMGSGQWSDLAGDGANVGQSPAINAALGFQDLFANQLVLQIVEQRFDLSFDVIIALWVERFFQLVLDGVDSILSLMFARNFKGFFQFDRPISVTLALSSSLTSASGISIFSLPSLARSSCCSSTSF